jgi:hypothetical protein
MPKTADVVDEFIQQMSGEQQEIANALRRMIRKAAKSLQESIKWGYPCYVGLGNICSIIPYPDHVNLSFFRGAELDDPDELLEGTGKGMRHVKIKTAKDIRKRAVADLIQSAVTLDKE